MQARTFVANLKLRLELSRTLNSALPELLELMQSNISERATTSTSAIELLTLCCQVRFADREGPGMWLPDQAATYPEHI